MTRIGASLHLLKTNPAVEHTLWQYAGCCRFVWNYFWRMNSDRLGAGKHILRYQEMDHWSKWLKQSDKYGFLADAPAHILQQKLRDLDRAYSDAFDKNQPNKRLPKKRKRHLHSSFRFLSPSQFVIVLSYWALVPIDSGRATTLRITISK